MAAIIVGILVGLGGLLMGGLAMAVSAVLSRVWAFTGPSPRWPRRRKRRRWDRPVAIPVPLSMPKSRGCPREDATSTSAAGRVRSGAAPVVLYKLGERFFVVDGNHRVSVARYQGVEWIEAEVTQLYAGAPSAPSALTDLDQTARKPEEASAGHRGLNRPPRKGNTTSTESRRAMEVSRTSSTCWTPIAGPTGEVDRGSNSTRPRMASWPAPT